MIKSIWSAWHTECPEDGNITVHAENEAQARRMAAVEFEIDDPEEAAIYIEIERITPRALKETE